MRALAVAIELVSYLLVPLGIAAAVRAWLLRRRRGYRQRVDVIGGDTVYDETTEPAEPAEPAEPEPQPDEGEGEGGDEAESEGEQGGDAQPASA